jgi:hypothetical protein
MGVARSPAQPRREHLAVHARHLVSNCVFESYEDIIDPICEAWNELIVLPQVIRSIGMREWAHATRCK